MHFSSVKMHFQSFKLGYISSTMEELNVLLLGRALYVLIPQFVSKCFHVCLAVGYFGE